ncbi:MAG: creatininase family protein [bacterium]|nr:creatininase family protein [bacterium]
MKKYKLDEMTYTEIKELDRSKTIFFLPISPIEQHGPHLPLGTDFYAAGDMAAMAITGLQKKEPSLNYILHPPIPLGSSECTMDFPGTISVRGKTIAKIIFDICSSIARHGFKYIIISSQHMDPVHLKAINVGMKKTMKKYDIKIFEPYSVVTWHRNTKEDTLWKEKGVDLQTEYHADVKETSFIQYKYPHLLKNGYEKIKPCCLDIEKLYKEGKKTFMKMGADEGYIGSPAKSEEEMGKIHLEVAAEILANTALKLYNGEKLPEMVKEWKFVMKFFIRLD